VVGSCRLASYLIAFVYCSTAAPSQVINEDAALIPDGAMLFDSIGESVSISGLIAVVGSPDADDNGGGSGSAYIFDANPTSTTFGEQLAKLLPEDGGENAFFGSSVSICGDVIAVAAICDSQLAECAGAVYLFDGDPTSNSFGTQLAKLVAPDGERADFFGRSVSGDGHVLAISAIGNDTHKSNTGSVYLFSVDPSTTDFGSFLIQLKADDAAQDDEFGNAVSLNGTTLAVSAWRDDDNGDNSGSAYLFNADPASSRFGDQLIKLIPNDGEEDDQFGWSLSLSDGIVVVGSLFDEDNGPVSGSAYLFDADSTSPTLGHQLAKLLPTDGQSFDSFGFSAALGSGLAIVGATQDDNEIGTNSGSVYVFDANPSSVSFGTQLSKLLTSNGQDNDHLGEAVAMDETAVIVGASRFNTAFSNFTGAAFLFDVNQLVPSKCSSADLAPELGVLDFSDVLSFLTAFAANDPAADLADPVGTFNFNDLIAFLTLFAAGCP